MTAIAHGRAYASDDQDFTGDTNWHTVLTATASNFVGGAKYLILCLLTEYGLNVNTNKVGVRVAHGATPTAFTESDILREPHQGSVLEGAQYFFWTVWTQPATAEDIVIQISLGTSTNTCSTRGGRVIQWIRLDTNLVENTDYFYGENTTTDAMSSGTAETRATISLDPPVAGDDWLILGRERYNHNSGAGGQLTFRMVSDPSGTPVVIGNPWFWGPKDPDDIVLFPNAHVVENHGASAVTYGIQDIGASTTPQHTHSAIFALNLDKFAQHSVAFDVDAVASAITFSDITPDGFTDPNVATAGDWFTLAVATLDVQDAARAGRIRIQIDAVDDPSGNDPGGSAGAQGPLNSGTATAELVGFVLGMPTFTTGTKAIDIDGIVDSTTGTPEFQSRLLLAWSMELPSTAFTGLIISSPPYQVP